MTIPRTFHQIWLGSSTPPELMLTWMARWRELHPNWTHKLWRDIDATTITCGDEVVTARWPELLHRACHLSQRSNIWRYELIARKGGVYLDTDMEPRANIESWLADHDAFIASQWHRDSVSGACFGACAGHPWMRDAVRSLAQQDPTVHMSMGDSFAHELYLRHREAICRAPREIFVFYPHRSFAIADRLISPATLAVHRWSCFWHPTGYAPLSSR